MPIFELAEKDSDVTGKATFEKRSDYMVIKLNGEDRPHMVHVIHGKKLIAKKVATEVKDSDLEEREQETVVTVDKDRSKAVFKK